MNIGIYAGSYDPFTFGHLSVVRGACKVFDRVVIAIGTNIHKEGLFARMERQEMVLEYLQVAQDTEADIFTYGKGAAKVSVSHFNGLLSDFVKVYSVRDRLSIVRGLRAVSDFEQEMAIADANRRQCPEVQTVFIPAESDRAFVSSSTVKELAMYENSDLSHYVLPSVGKKLKKRLKSINSK